MNGVSRSAVDESRVTFVADESNPNRFLPQIASGGSNRDFDPDDMPRVMDFEGIPEPPGDTGLMYCEEGPHGLLFPTYHFCLRAGYFFYFDVEDVDDESGPYPTYLSPPIGVIPLEKTAVEFPPGGRRVFREHAQTNARTGYELVILHVPDDAEEGVRPPAFIVAESMGNREKWATALRARSGINKSTVLRAGYSATSRAKAVATNVAAAAIKEDEPTTSAAAATTDNSQQRRAASKPTSIKKRDGKPKTIQQQVLEASEDAELAHAVVEFGTPDFHEKDWMTRYFQTHNDFDAPTKCRQMEHWLTDMKKSLKGAVLEQYTYFVQASGEMTTMGREVSSLKALVEAQVDTIKELKELDFSRSLHADGRDEIMRDGNDGSAGQEESDPRLSRRRKENGRRLVADDISEISSVEGSSKRNMDESYGDEDGGSTDAPPPIHVPEWLDDVGEDLAAIVRECRYNEAVELYNKAKTEVADLIDKHERPTTYRLSKKQLSNLQEMQKTLDNMAKRIGGRMEETLRRKNEALKQASKRERSDLSTAVSSLISPCALNDDAVPLQLLVKLGRTREAAEAYSARRSLLLLETLHERPISGSGTVDLVIYAAQLSQSFFSCLASSMEGFLDLFLMSSPQMMSANGDKQEDMSLGESSLHSATTKGIPAGAVASVVLWCDSELAKFASAFGGTRILANLALSPPPRDVPKKPRVVGGGEVDDANGSKERKNAIEVASQCIDQAFLYASQNLDSVGLPLTPRLAEYIRARLKGCEAEVSELLEDRWQHLTADWRIAPDVYGLAMNDR